jgi:hypothetical protein
MMVIQHRVCLVSRPSRECYAEICRHSRIICVAHGKRIVAYVCEFVCIACGFVYIDGSPGVKVSPSTICVN